MWKWFLHSSILERIEFDLSKIKWLRGIILLHSNNGGALGQVSIIQTPFFFGKLTYVLKEEDTNIIRGIPQIYNDNRNIKQQMATG